MENKLQERIFILEFIDVYRSLPALWDVTSKDYTNRKKKHEQYKILIAKYREKFPGADRQDVTKKINSLRTTFRKELRRIREAEESGVATKNLQSSVWFFEELKFLVSYETPAESTSALESIQDSPEVENEDGNTSDSHPISQATVSPRCRPITKKRKKEDPADTLVRMVCRRLQHPPNQGDDLDKLVAVWATELRKMNPQQQLFAKKGINDVIFEGQMGSLHRNSVEINARRISDHSE